MDVIIAKDSGFCFGVKRAVEIAINATGKTSVLGELVHNRDVTGMLEKKGIRTVHSIEEAKEGNIIIRSHGEADSVVDKARDSGLNVIDATCTNVKRVQRLAKELEAKGYNVIIFGSKEHAEVAGIAGNLKKAVILENAEELKGMKLGRKDAIIFQTTYPEETYHCVIALLKGMKEKPYVADTICPVTSLRQKSALRLCEKVDIMIVIGGLHSSNTKKLAHACSEIVETYHIENKDGLRREWFIGKKKAGVTAGASTPENVINEVADEIRRY